MAHRGYVGLFWDYENCTPSSSSGVTVGRRIQEVALRFGTVKLMKGYFELASKKPNVLRSALQCAGISLTDCPHNGRKDVADKMILVDMFLFAMTTPTPATVILISGDRDFAYAVSSLRLQGYHVVVVAPREAHASLLAQASEVLSWNDDILNKQARELHTNNASQTIAERPAVVSPSTTSAMLAQRNEMEGFSPSNAPAILQVHEAEQASVTCVASCDTIQHAGGHEEKACVGVDSVTQSIKVQIVAGRTGQRKSSSVIGRMTSAFVSFIPAGFLPPPPPMRLAPSAGGRPALIMHAQQVEALSCVSSISAVSCCTTGVDCQTSQTAEVEISSPAESSTISLPSTSSEASVGSGSTSAATKGHASARHADVISAGEDAASACAEPSDLSTSASSSTDTAVSLSTTSTDIADLRASINAARSSVDLAEATSSSGVTRIDPIPQTPIATPLPVPPHFHPLLQHLQACSAAGFSKQKWASVAEQLLGSKPTLYADAQVKRFSQYIANAEALGIVVSHRDPGSGDLVWLNPAWPSLSGSAGGTS